MGMLINIIEYLEKRKAVEMAGHPLLKSMVSHYEITKKENPKTIILYAINDFYELIFDDAKIFSENTGLPLTTSLHRIPMAGFPADDLIKFQSILTAQGYSQTVIFNPLKTNFQADYDQK